MPPPKQKSNFLARAVAVTGFGLWLVAAAAFFLQDTERMSVNRLAGLGFQWEQEKRIAVVEAHARAQMDAATLAKAEPSLRNLGCRKLDLTDCRYLTNIDGLKGLATLTSPATA